MSSPQIEPEKRLFEIEQVEQGYRRAIYSVIAIDEAHAIEALSGDDSAGEVLANPDIGEFDVSNVWDIEVRLVQGFGSIYGGRNG